MKNVNKDHLNLPKPGFKRGGSCINQLISILHEICEQLHHWIEVRSVFLDIAKDFAKLRYEGALFKLISGNLLKTLIDFLKNRKQRATLNEQASSWTDVNVGVPHGSN